MVVDLDLDLDLEGTRPLRLPLADTPLRRPRWSLLRAQVAPTVAKASAVPQSALDAS